MRGWADRIAEELGEGRREFGYANLAISGLVLREILDQQLEPALNLKPDLVSLSAGGNDLVFHRGDPDRMAAALDDAVAVLSATGATVVLFTGPDWGETAVFGHIRGKVAVFNENIRVIAARHDVVIADLWALRQLSDPRMWDPDRLHFSPLGHHTIAAMVLDTLSVPHRLHPLEPKPMPPGNWRETRASDLAWMAHYMLPLDGEPDQAARGRPAPAGQTPTAGTASRGSGLRAQTPSPAGFGRLVCRNGPQPGIDGDHEERSCLITLTAFLKLSEPRTRASMRPSGTASPRPPRPSETLTGLKSRRSAATLKTGRSPTGRSPSSWGSAWSVDARLRSGTARTAPLRSNPQPVRAEEARAERKTSCATRIWAAPA
ncbi:lysophospholipase L1-like esterase [Arthrobacter sp. MW3 TE3886]